MIELDNEFFCKRAITYFVLGRIDIVLVECIPATGSLYWLRKWTYCTTYINKQNIKTSCGGPPNRYRGLVERKKTC